MAEYIDPHPRTPPDDIVFNNALASITVCVPRIEHHAFAVRRITSVVVAVSEVAGPKHVRAGTIVVIGRPWVVDFGNTDRILVRIKGEGSHDRELI